jgi:hypothetical protein
LVASTTSICGHEMPINSINISRSYNVIWPISICIRSPHHRITNNTLSY